MKKLLAIYYTFWGSFAMMGFLCSCSEASQRTVVEIGLVSTVKNVVKSDNRPIRTFTIPDIPIMLQTTESRLDYLVRHYWDGFNFQDTVYIHLPDVTEQALVNYLDLLVKVPVALADSCIERMLCKASLQPKMLGYFTETIHRYTMDPNSPIRNEEIYLPVTRFLLHNPTIDEALRIKADFDRKQILLNRRGSIANDFVYTQASGEQNRMHQLTTDYTLLVFYDPDCQSCEQELEYMKNSSLFTNTDFLKNVTVLAFYAGDNITSWKTFQHHIPNEWVNAYDKEGVVLANMLYNLEATPSLYLLNRGKCVIMKDARIEEVENFFMQSY